MANHWATRWINQAANGQKLRLDPCHLPQNIVYTAQKSGSRLSCCLNERRILVQTGDEHPDSNVLHILSPQHFRGVAARKVETGNGQKAISLSLLHANPDFSIPLLISCHPDDILLDWRLWADIYDLPMLTVDANGRVSHVMGRFPLQRLMNSKEKKPRPAFLLRCRGRSLNVRLVIANQVMLG